MRPIFAIYLAAGLTLVFALWFGVSDGYRAYAARESIAILQPEQKDLIRMQRVMRDSFESSCWLLGLSVLQAIVLISAKRLNKAMGKPAPIG